MRALVVLVAAAVLAVAAPVTARAADPPVTARAADPPAPKTVVLDGAQLVDVKRQLAGTPDARLAAAFAALKRAADKDLTAGPWSVMTKKSTISTDKHDYYSLATYFWPDPDTPDGCPYVRKNGRWGPDVNSGDLLALNTAWPAIGRLALAWFYTGNEAYARRAALDVRTWFLDPATRMNPNMTFGQVVPCTKVGRKEGIIETSEQITEVIDALAILDTGAPGWSTADHQGMTGWLAQV